MEYWKEVDFWYNSRHIVSLMQKYVYFHSQALQREFNNHTVTLLNSEKMVIHLPREYLRIARYFLTRGRSISVEVSSHRQPCKKLCGRMEIPCCKLTKTALLEATKLAKAMINAYAGGIVMQFMKFLLFRYTGLYTDCKLFAEKC